MSTHPLAPSPSLLLSDLLSGIAQDAYRTRSALATTFCTAGRLLGRHLPFLPPLVVPLLIPSALLFNTCNNDEGLLKRISWVAPTMGIGLTTAVACASYNAISSPFLKGMICGAHSSALGILSAPLAGGMLGIISLQSVLSHWFEPLEQEEDETAADPMACVTFAVSTLGLTLLQQHPIVATTGGWITSVTIDTIVRSLRKTTHQQ